MIKIVSQLINENPELLAEVVRRLKAIPGSSSWMCFYTFGELVKAKDFLSEYEMRFTPEQHRSFMSRFDSDCEKNILQTLMKSSGDDVLKRVESRVKVSTEKTKRFIESILEEIDHENELNRLVEEAKSKRTKQKSSMDVDYEKLKSIFA